MNSNDNPGGKRDGRTAFSIPDFGTEPDENAAKSLGRYRRLFLAELRPAPTHPALDRHPGPWHVRMHYSGAYERVRVYVVLDRHNRRVCECYDENVAEAIARSWESIR